MSGNDFSPISVSTIDRIRELHDTFGFRDLPSDAKKRLLAELECHRETLNAAFSHRKQNGPKLGMADSDGYFSEKLTSLISMAQIAIAPETDEVSFTQEQSASNIEHFAYLVKGLVNG